MNCLPRRSSMERRGVLPDHEPPRLECFGIRGWNRKVCALRFLILGLLLFMSYNAYSEVTAKMSGAGDWRISSLDSVDMMDSPVPSKHVVWVKQNGKWDHRPYVISEFLLKEQLIELKTLMDHIDNSIPADYLIAVYYNFESKNFMIYFDQAFWKNETLHRNLAAKLREELRN
jgi:hypothetical protein